METLLVYPRKTEERTGSTPQRILVYLRPNQGKKEQTRSATRSFPVPTLLPDLVGTENGEKRKLPNFLTDEYGSATKNT